MENQNDYQEKLCPFINHRFCLKRPCLFFDETENGCLLLIRLKAGKSE
jgi:hypothetical protein